MNIPRTISTEHLLDAMSTAVIMIDTQLNILHLNAPAEMMLGVSRKMALNKNIFKTFPCCDSINEQIHKVIETQRTYSARDLQIQLLEQQKMTVDCVITPVIPDALVTEFLILELTQIDRRLRLSREDHLVHQGEGTRGLLRGVAHEIKNPLGGIRGAAQLLADELPSDDLQEYTNVISHEVDRLQDLVDRMLGPRQLPRIEPVSVHELLEHTRTLIVAEAKDHLDIVCDYDPSLPDIQADRGMLQQAFLNLATNALHAVRELNPAQIILRTRPERQFTIGQTRHRLVLKIEIIDNGPGIAEEMLENIFLPMVTDKPDGTGLGLPIAQTLVQRHGGLIECEACDGKTCFIIYLPLETSYATK